MTDPDYYKDRMACRGAAVLEAWHDMAECRECGRCVRWDMQEHAFFGFGTCEHAPKRSADAAITRVGGRA